MFDRWVSRLPLPLTPADRAVGYRWELSLRHVELSRPARNGVHLAIRLVDALFGEGLCIQGQREIVGDIARAIDRSRRERDGSRL